MSTLPTTSAKDQHYIPKFYLKGFTDREHQLWVFEKFKPMRASKPKQEAHRPDYYTHSEEGQRDETAENILKEAESRVAPIIHKLGSPQYVLTPENAGHLIVFVAFMFARVPCWREHLDNMAADVVRKAQIRIANDKERFHKSVEDFEKSAGRSVGMDYEELRQFILKGDYEIAQKSVGFNLGVMLECAFHVMDVLRNFGYQRLYAPEGMYFLTSDSPVFTIQPDGKGHAMVGMGFRWPGVEAYFPLNKRACLRLTKGIQPSMVILKERNIEQINRLTMATATRYLYSSQGYRRIARLFDEHGCKVRPGKESFLLPTPSGQQIA